MQEKNSSWPLELVPRLAKLGSLNNDVLSAAALVACKLERDIANSWLSLSVDGEDILTEFDSFTDYFGTLNLAIATAIDVDR